MTRWVRRLINVFRRARLERELDAELRVHLALETERNLRAGLPPAEARRLAYARLGGVEQVKERFRETHPFRWLGGFWLDVKLGLRILVKHPGLTCVAGFALAVGIPLGLLPMHATNALEAPPPFDEAGQILVLKNFNVATSRWETPSVYDFVQWREQLTTFDDLAVTTRGASYNVLSEDGRAGPVRGAEITAAAFEIVRVPPRLGRPLIPADEVIGAPRVVVVSYDLWQSRLDGDPDVVGRSLRIGGVPRTVVGVMPEGFLFPVQEQLWLPLPMNAFIDEHESRGTRMLIFGRLADGVSPDEAQAELTAAGRRLASAFPAMHEHLRQEVTPFTIGLFDAGAELAIAFYLFQILALLVLVVACANVGMLIFSRTATRARELAVRTALGASRTRVISQLFTEALVLAVLAAGVGLVILDWVAPLLFDWALDVLPYWIDLGVSRTTVLWALSLAVLSAGLVSIVPALRVTGSAIQWNMQRTTAERAGTKFGGRKHVEESVATGAAAGRGRGGRFSAGRKRDSRLGGAAPVRLGVGRSSLLDRLGSVAYYGPVGAVSRGPECWPGQHCSGAAGDRERDPVEHATHDRGARWNQVRRGVERAPRRRRGGRCGGGGRGGWAVGHADGSHIRCDEH